MEYKANQFYRFLFFFILVKIFLYGKLIRKIAIYEIIKYILNIERKKTYCSEITRLVCLRRIMKRQVILIHRVNNQIVSLLFVCVESHEKQGVVPCSHA